MRTPELPSGNHPVPVGKTTRGRFPSSPPSRKSSSRLSPSPVPPSSVTPGRRRAKSPIPETTPTRLRQHITMTTGASESILGLQRTRKPLSPPTEVSGVPSDVLLPSRNEPLRDRSLSKPPAPPGIMLEPTSEYAPMHPPAAYGEGPSAHPSPQFDPYNLYPGIPSYPIVGGPPAHRTFHPQGPYYQHTAPSYQLPPGLAAPPHRFMRSQSPNGPYILPHRTGGGLPRERLYPESDTSDWVPSGYPDAGSGYSESRRQTPLPRPPLPPKPSELASTSVPSSATYTGTSDSLPVFSEPHTSPNDMQLDPTLLPPPKRSELALTGVPSSATSRTDDVSLLFSDQQISLNEQLRPTLLPQQEAANPPADATPSEPRESPKHTPQDDEGRKSLATSPKPSPVAGGRPTKKTLSLIDEGFDRITEIIEGLAEATGKAPSDLYRRLEKSRKGTHEGKWWNIYLHYFARHEEEEAARIDEPLERTQSFRSLCYTQYKTDNPHFQEILETYRELHMADTEVTVGHRKREIERYERKMRDMANEAYRTLDVDTWFMTAGNIVLSDPGLVSFFETPNAIGFLSDKTNIEPNEAQAAFTAHIYNQKAMDSLAFARDPKPTSPHIKSEDVSWPADNASPSSWLANIKTKIYEIFKGLGITISMSQFPWKSLLAILAKNGVIMRGYPNILMPGEVRGTNKTKGIGDLFSTEQLELATALELHGRTDFPIRLSRVPHDQLEATKSGKSPVIICRPPAPGSDVGRARQAYFALQTKTAEFRPDGPRRLDQGGRQPIRAHVPVEENIIVVTSSSPPSKAASVADSTSSEVIASSPQPAIRVPQKRKASVDSASSQSDDDDPYVPDPKVKKPNTGALRQKTAAAKGERKTRGANVKGKAKEAAGKEKGRQARAGQAKKGVKSVQFIEDEDSSASEEPPTSRPKPRPAYTGAGGQKESKSESQREPAPTSKPRKATIPTPEPQKVVVSTLEPRKAPASTPEPQKAATTTPKPSEATRPPPTSAIPPAPVPAAPVVPTHGVAHEPHRPLHGYTTDEHDHYHHERPPINHPHPPRYPGDGEAPHDHYAFRGDYYGYPPPFPREYYSPYPPPMHPSRQPAYAAPPPAPYHQQPHHDPHMRPDVPRGTTGNALASSSRLSPSDHGTT